MANDNHLFSAPCYDGTMEDLDFSGLLANCSPLKILKLQKNLLQIAVENYFIVQTYVSNDRTDYDTLIPVLEKHKNAFGEILEEVTALQRLQIQSKMSL